MRRFDELTEREVLALAISLEEEDERVYADIADGLRADYPSTAEMFEGMRQEESGHRRRLIEVFRERFGEHIPLIRRHDVRGFITRRPVWLIRPLPLDTIRHQAASLEIESRKDAIRVRLNGQPAAEYPGDPARSLTGPIGLQLHDQFTLVMFRNIRIRQLP